MVAGKADINQTITLSRSPVLLDSIRVSVDGVNWSRVKSFTDSERRREFRVEYNANYEAFIFFGNNRSGLIPSTGSPIQITYRVGGGPIGNITTGSLQEQRQIPVPGQAFSATVTFFNQTRGEFGFSGDTIDDIRRKLPAYLSTQDRAVSGNDYKTLADQFATPFHGQIGKSTAVLRNHGCAGNIIDLYILARNGDNGLTGASNELKNDLIEEFENGVNRFDQAIHAAPCVIYRRLNISWEPMIVARGRPVTCQPPNGVLRALEWNCSGSTVHSSAALSTTRSTLSASSTRLKSSSRLTPSRCG